MRRLVTEVVLSRKQHKLMLWKAQFRGCCRSTCISLEQLSEDTKTRMLTFRKFTAEVRSVLSLSEDMYRTLK